MDVVVGDSVAVSTIGDGARTAIGAAMGTAVKVSDAELLRWIGALVGAVGCMAIGAATGKTVLLSDAVPFRKVGALVGSTG